MIANLVLLTFSYSICKPCCHHHRWRSIYMFSFCLHCLLHCMQILPLQVSPSSIYPGLQCEHWYEPKVLTHSPSAGQSCFPDTHSSTSTQNLRKKSKLKTPQDETPRPTLWKWPCVSVYFSFCSSSCLSFSHLLSQDSFACSPVFSPWCCTNNFLEIIAA